MTPVPPAPMLATIGVLPLDTSGYCFEAKWDGRWRVAISGLSSSAAFLDRLTSAFPRPRKAAGRVQPAAKDTESTDEDAAGPKLRPAPVA